MNPTYYNHFLPWSPLYTGLGIIGATVAFILLILIIALKGYALWHAARRSEKKWFIALLILNTFGILELIYLYFVIGKWHRFKNSGTPTSPSSSNSFK